MPDGDDRDLTPYDLAERLVHGLPVTDQGKFEIAQELMWLRGMVQTTRQFLKTGGSSHPATNAIDRDDGEANRWLGSSRARQSTES
jgi:hypothetical protein